MPSSSNSSRIHIRDALPGEMPAITELAVSAFTRFEVFGPSWWSDAGVLPSMLGSLAGGLSRVAVEGSQGRPVGHAQWTPCRMRLGGQPVEAAYLAPLSVHADWQGRGIGSALMRDGIACLRARGVRILLILGHEEYYPRFGLQTGCHGRHGLRVDCPPVLEADPAGWCLRPVLDRDAPGFRSLWQELCGEADGAVDPGPGLLPWVSKTRDIVACTLERDGRVVGHARFDCRPAAGAADGILRFLAADSDAARVLAGRILGRTGWTGQRLGLPLPAAVAAVRSLLAGPPWGTLEPVHEWWGPGMAMDLREDAPPADVTAGHRADQPGQPDPGTCLAAIRRRDQPPLFVEWPPIFDF